MLTKMQASYATLSGIMEYQRFQEGLWVGVNMMVELFALSGEV